MSRKPAVLVVVAVAFATLTAFVAYRLGLRHSVSSTSRPAVPAGSRKAGCVDFRNAGSHTGETSCISGRVLRVFTSRGGNTFLDFCSDYHTCPFTAVVFASDRSKFGNLGALSGHQVELEGLIGVYQGRAEIVIRDPEQLRAVSEE